MKGLTKFVTVLAKVLEIFSWVGSALSAVSLVVIAIGKTALLRYLSDIEVSSDLSVGGFSIDVSVVDPARLVRVYVIIFVVAVLVCLLMAMIFRNIYLIFKTAEGQTKFSKGRTPFQPDIVRMVREIGIFSLAIPVVELIMSIIARLVIGHEVAEVAVSVDMTSIFFGLVVLCLSQFFAYGAQLQEDMEGLV
ncbi:MAG TPA: hypothetical protein DCM49_01655 [Lachnospiraceae bacterium]|nr:hypothetical protein [Lachnospiraceae bacterium]